MDEATREAILDRRVQDRLRGDRAYRNAANAEEQAKREAEIEAEEEAKMIRTQGHVEAEPEPEPQPTLRELMIRREASRLLDAGWTMAQGLTIVRYAARDELREIERNPNGTAWITVDWEGYDWTGLLLPDGTIDWKADTFVGHGIRTEEKQGRTPVVHVEEYTGPMFRKWRLRLRSNGEWDAVPADPKSPYITPGFDTRAAVVRFLETGGEA